jgi:hypothetical protein
MTTSPVINGPFAKNPETTSSSGLLQAVLKKAGICALFCLNGKVKNIPMPALVSAGASAVGLLSGIGYCLTHSDLTGSDSPLTQRIHQFFSKIALFALALVFASGLTFAGRQTIKALT